MNKSYKRLLPLTAGIFLTLACISSMAEFFRYIDFMYPEDWVDSLPNLIAAIVTGFIGIPLSISSIEKLSDKNA